MTEAQAITLANLASKTEQEVFDYVAAHLLKQNAKAQDGISCMYRTNEGLRCAAGCLIADGEYLPEYEGDSWYGVIVNHCETVPKAHQGLICDLQTVHDSRTVSDWRNELNRVAGEYNLKGLTP